jgi:hypothetical protein
VTHHSKDSLSQLVGNQQHDVCTVGELFEQLDETSKNSGNDAFQILEGLVDRGLRVLSQPTRCIELEAASGIGASEIKAAFVKAKNVSAIDTENAFWTISKGTPSEYNKLLHGPFVVRSNLKEGCRLSSILGLRWPDEEYSIAWLSDVTPYKERAEAGAFDERDPKADIHELRAEITALGDCLINYLAARTT